MSVKATPSQQTIVLLALVASSFITVRDNGLLPEIKEAVEKGALDLLDIIAEFREVSDQNENLTATSQILAGVSKVINKSDKWFSAEVVVSLGMKICTDLLGETCNPKKRKLLERALRSIKALDDFVDPDGENEEAFIEVEEILDSVYKELGFSIELRYLQHHRKLQRRLRRHARGQL